MKTENSNRKKNFFSQQQPTHSFQTSKMNVLNIIYVRLMFQQRTNEKLLVVSHSNIKSFLLS